MRHVLVATLERHDLVDGLRAAAPASTVFVSTRGVEETLERLFKSARVDLVVTDDPGILMEIYHDVPGGLPVYLARPDEDVVSILAGLDGLSAA
jgi:hypothetical protein